MKGLCLLLVSALVLVAGQAPGDEDELCTVFLPSQGQNVLNDPPTVRPLMDSTHYEHLLPPNNGPVWQRLNLDNNNGRGGTIEWIQQGGQCTHRVFACGYQSGTQDNWLITQHINTTVDGVRLSQVTVQFEYQQTTCPTSGANACQRVFDVLKYETSTIDLAAARDTNNYVNVESLTTSITNEGETQTATVDVTLSTQESGFYLAVRDPGTCVLFSRVLVFYYVCPPNTVEGLATGPETIAPVGTTPLQVPATCVENASPANGGAVSLTCLQQGTWLSSGGGCECDDGFVRSSDLRECIKCEAGFYESVAIGVCMLCPNNSNSTEPGLAECPCDSGYYREPGEPDEPCYLPPSPPRNVMVVSQTSTSVTLSWNEALSTGGRSRDELRYNLWYREVGSSQIVLAETLLTTRGTISGLTADIQYDIFVTADTNVTAGVLPTLAPERTVSLMFGTQLIAPGVIAGIVVGVLVVILILIALVVLLLCCLLKQRKVVKETISNYAAANTIEIPTTGKRMYVDPTTYASPDEAVKDFATEVHPRSVRLMEEIGAGEFGNVYKGIWKVDGKQIPIAVKTLKPGSSGRMRNDFLTEASIMGQFNHPNVIKLYGVVTKVEPVMIVMEFMDNGSLYHYLRKYDDRLSVERQVKMAKCVAEGMDYLSTVGFVHRDLAARNVLVGKEEVCKVADFGLSRETVDDEYDVKKGGKIPVRWTAPEAIFKRRFTSASDVWSFGVLLWEIMSYAQHPYEAFDWDNQTVLDKLEAGYRLDNPDGCPQSVYQLMLNCWHAEKNDRPTFAEIVKYLEQLIENNMQVSIPNPAANKKVPKTYLTSANILNPLEYSTVLDWLVAIKMDRYKEKFENAGYSEISDVLTLNEADLKSMGITLAGHLYRITSSIEKAQTQVSRQPSVKV